MKPDDALATFLKNYGFGKRALEAYLDRPALKNQAQGEDNEIFVYGPIVEEDVRAIYEKWFDDHSVVSATSFKNKLKDITGDVVVRINSPGGMVFEGAAMNSLLRDHPGNATIKIDGLCGSAATFLMLNSAHVIAGEMAQIFIHNSHVCTCGNRNDLREMADLLEKTDGQIRDLYAKRMNMKGEEIADLMNKETTFTAKEAVNAGLVDEMVDAESDPAPPDPEGQEAAVKRNQARAKARAGFLDLMLAQEGKTHGVK